jgi:predicted MFS family arabinose efflux permease
VNLTGYLAGVLGGRALARGVGTSRALDIGMALAVGSFAACAWNGGLAWLALWRGVAGLAGGILMALTGPAVQGAVAATLRGRAGGVVLTGVGSGVIVGSVLVPLSLPGGLPLAWLALALLTAILWSFAHPRWPAGQVPAPTGAPRAKATALYVLYALGAAGIVPHFVYFVDFAVRGRGLDPDFGTAIWLLFGAGAIAGTLLGGRAADRLGTVTSLRLWLAAQAVGAGCALLPGTAVLVPSAVLGAFGNIGLTAVALTRARELAGPEAGLVWVRATAVYAIAQAITGFGLTALFAQTGSHEALFGAGFLLSLAALVASLHRA